MVTKIRQHCVNNFILRKIIIVKNFNGPEFLEPVVVIYFEQLVFLLSSIFTVLFARHTTCFEYEFFISLVAHAFFREIFRVGILRKLKWVVCIINCTVVSKSRHFQKDFHGRFNRGKRCRVNHPCHNHVLTVYSIISRCINYILSKM